ncbi:hypothetical protein EYF80_017165 [Liparis tanakae]|uniref:Uncharacterized protein n=1 Tax=Liparis tanakae TaxID=230148 RepID=A0A4Z2I3P1_9TELE|nr:hypothetical protein EYF80_017165 [Liparis tanakae]
MQSDHPVLDCHPVYKGLLVINEVGVRHPELVCHPVIQSEIERDACVGEALVSPGLLETGGVKLIFTEGHIRLMAALKGPVKPTGSSERAATLEPNVGPPGTKHLEGIEPDQPEDPFSSLGQMLAWIEGMRQAQAEENRQFFKTLQNPPALRPTPVPRDTLELPTPEPQDPSELLTPEPQDPSALLSPDPQDPCVTTSRKTVLEDEPVLGHSSYQTMISCLGPLCSQTLRKLEAGRANMERAEPAKRESAEWELTMLTSDTMSMLAMSMLMPTSTGAPVGNMTECKHEAVRRSST